MAELSNLWAEELGRERPLEYVKMKEANSLTGQFARFTPTERDARLLRFIGHIKKTALIGFSSVVPHEFFELMRDMDVRGHLTRTYFHTFYASMISLLKYVKDQGIPGPIDFTFDEQMHESDIVLSEYSRFLESVPRDVRPLLGVRPIHRKDTEVMQLQAADVLVWHARRYHAARSNGETFGSPVFDALTDLPLFEDFLTMPRMLKHAQLLRVAQEDVATISPFTPGKPQP